MEMILQKLPDSSIQEYQGINSIDKFQPLKEKGRCQFDEPETAVKISGILTMVLSENWVKVGPEYARSTP